MTIAAAEQEELVLFEFQGEITHTLFESFDSMELGKLEEKEGVMS